MDGWEGVFMENKSNCPELSIYENYAIVLAELEARKKKIDAAIDGVEMILREVHETEKENPDVNSQ